MNKEKDFFAEIIESSLTHFIAQCWNWDNFPSFGALVEIETDDLLTIGIVTQISTGSHDPIRYPFPYQKTEEELRAEQPQIFEFLKTTFKSLIVGYIQKSMGKKRLFYLLPPNPCKIHAFVARATEQTFDKFFSKSDFLHTIFSAEQTNPGVDDLLLAIFKNIQELNLITDEKLSEFCDTISILSGNDYRRLKTFLSRLQSII